tara:strand:+ start:297 stop:560 length:264 start_codon:yes stop_codon:yes gene_type:complete
MDNRKKQIEEYLIASLNPNVLNIDNKSSLHQGHAGDDGTGETHYLVEIGSDAFHGKSRIECHRMINEALKPVFDKGLHALEIKIAKT